MFHLPRDVVSVKKIEVLLAEPKSAEDVSALPQKVGVFPHRLACTHALSHARTHAICLLLVANFFA
jgi:hypothetical protein